MANDEEKKGKKTSGGVRAFFRNLVGLAPAQSDLENTPKELKDGINAQVQQQAEGVSGAYVVPSNNEFNGSESSVDKEKSQKAVSIANVLLGGGLVKFNSEYEKGLVIKLLENGIEETNGVIKLKQAQLPLSDKEFSDKQLDLSDKLKDLFANPGNAADNRPVLEAATREDAKVGATDPVGQRPVESASSNASVPPSVARAQPLWMDKTSPYERVIGLLNQEVKANSSLSQEAKYLHEYLVKENTSQRKESKQNFTGAQIGQKIDDYVQLNANLERAEKILILKVAKNVLAELSPILAENVNPASKERGAPQERGPLSVRPDTLKNKDVGAKVESAAVKEWKKKKTAFNSIDDLERDLDVQMKAANRTGQSEEKTKPLENLFDDASLQAPKGAPVTQADLDKELAALQGTAPSRPAKPSSDAMSNALYKAFDESKDDKQRGRLAEIMEFREKHSEYLADLREDFKDPNGESHSFDSLLSHKKVLEKEIQELQSKKDPLSRMLVADYKQKIIEVESVAKEVFNKEIWKETGPSEDVAAKSGLGSRQKFREQELKKLQESGSANISVQKVAALSRKENRNDIAPLLNNPAEIQVKCPPRILQEFQKLVESAPKLLGAHFENPYTGKIEVLPSKAEEFTARHLQILARNENENVTGFMNRNKELYGDALTGDQVARLRCLVKATTVSGLVNVGIEGGFPRGEPSRKDVPEKMILIDQSGLQWQGDLRNTGGMFFYPNDMASIKIENYAAWQSDMYKAMYGGERPKEPSANSVEVEWKAIKGKLDLTQVALGIQVEFLQALEAAGSIKDNDAPDKKVNLRYLKAGMGFFASGLTIDKKDGRDNPALLGARLDGIEAALKYLQKLPEAERKQILGNMGRLELPFSGGEQYTAKLQKIEELTKAIGLVWGGAGVIDALAAAPDKYINASTTGADPHAMPGNEGGYRSVDAMMSMNARIEHLNAAANTAMKLAPSVDFGQAITDKINYALTQLRDSGTTPEEKAAAQAKAASMKGVVQVLLETGIPVNAQNLVNYAKELKQSTQLCKALLTDRKTTIVDILEEIRIQLDKNKGNPEAQKDILIRSDFMLKTLLNLNVTPNFGISSGLNDLRALLIIKEDRQSNTEVKKKFEEIKNVLPDNLKTQFQDTLKVGLASEVLVAPPREKAPEELISVETLMQNVGKGKQKDYNVVIEQMANDLMTKTAQASVKVGEDEFYNKQWEKTKTPEDKEKSKNWANFVNLNNMITYNLVAESIYKGNPSVEEMSNRAIFWAKVAAALIKKGDYSSASGITNFLESAAFYQPLNSQKFKEAFDPVREVLSPMKSYQNYRNDVASRVANDQGYISHTAVMTSNLTPIFEANPDETSDKIFNVGKLSMITSALDFSLTGQREYQKKLATSHAPTFDLSRLSESNLAMSPESVSAFTRVQFGFTVNLPPEGSAAATVTNDLAQIKQAMLQNYNKLIWEVPFKRGNAESFSTNYTAFLEVIKTELEKDTNKNNKELRALAGEMVALIQAHAEKGKKEFNADASELLQKLKDEHKLKIPRKPDLTGAGQPSSAIAQASVSPQVTVPVSAATVTPTVAQVQPVASATATPVRPNTPPVNAGFKRTEPKSAGQEQPARVLGSAAEAIIREDAKKTENDSQAELDAAFDGLDDLVKKSADEKKKDTKSKNQTESNYVFPSLKGLNTAEEKNQWVEILAAKIIKGEALQFRDSKDASNVINILRSVENASKSKGGDIHLSKGDAGNAVVVYDIAKLNNPTIERIKQLGTAKLSGLAGTPSVANDRTALERQPVAKAATPIRASVTSEDLDKMITDLKDDANFNDEEPKKKKGKKAKRDKVGGFSRKDIKAAEAALGNFASMADLAKSDVITATESTKPAEGATAEKTGLDRIKATDGAYHVFGGGKYGELQKGVDEYFSSKPELEQVAKKVRKYLEIRALSVAWEVPPLPQGVPQELKVVLEEKLKEVPPNSVVNFNKVLTEFWTTEDTFSNNLQYFKGLIDSSYKKEPVPTTQEEKLARLIESIYKDKTPVDSSEEANKVKEKDKKAKESPLSVEDVNSLDSFLKNAQVLISLQEQLFEIKQKCSFGEGTLAEQKMDVNKFFSDDNFKKFSNLMLAEIKVLKPMVVLYEQELVKSKLNGTRFAGMEKVTNDPLSSLTIQPVQRGPRYVMLLTEMKNKMPPDSPHYEKLQELINTVQNETLAINTSVAQQAAIATVHAVLQNEKKKIDSTEADVFLNFLAKDGLLGSMSYNIKAVGKGIETAESQLNSVAKDNKEIVKNEISSLKKSIKEEQKPVEDKKDEGSQNVVKSANAQKMERYEKIQETHIGKGEKIILDAAKLQPGDLQKIVLHAIMYGIDPDKIEIAKNVEKNKTQIGNIPFYEKAQNAAELWAQVGPVVIRPEMIEGLNLDKKDVKRMMETIEVFKQKGATNLDVKLPDSLQALAEKASRRHAGTFAPQDDSKTGADIDAGLETNARKQGKAARARQIFSGVINRDRNQQAEPLAARPVTINISEPVNVPLASNQAANLPIKPVDAGDKQKLVEWAGKVVDHYLQTGIPLPATVDVKGTIVDAKPDQLKVLVEAMVTLQSNGTVFNIPKDSSFITQLQDLGTSHANDIKVMANVQILLTPSTPNLAATSSQTQPTATAIVSGSTQATPDKPKESKPAFTVGSARLTSTTTPPPKVTVTGARTTPLTGFPLLLKNAQNAYGEYIKQNRAKGYDSAVMKIASEMANMGMQFQTMSSMPLEQKSEQYRKKLEELLTNTSPDAAGVKSFITEKLGNDLKVLPQANTLPQRPLSPQSPPVQQQPVVPTASSVIPPRKPPSWMQRPADSNSQQAANLGSNAPKTASPQSGVSGAQPVQQVPRTQQPPRTGVPIVEKPVSQPQQPRVISPSQPPVWSSRVTARPEVTQAFRIEGAHVDAFRSAALQNDIVLIRPLRDSNDTKNQVEFTPRELEGIAVRGGRVPSCVATFKPGEGDKPGATSYGMKPGTSFQSNESSALLAFLVKKAFDAHLENPETKDKKLVITVLQDMGESRQTEFVKLIKEEAQRRIDVGALDRNNIAVNKAGEPEPIPLDLKARANVARK